MVASRAGSIVLLASMLARTGGVNCAAYATSKGAVLGLARSIALEVAADGVRVNVLTPGLSDTPQPRGHLTEEQLAAKGRATPLGRLGTVDDMVEGCLFLLGSDATYFTGQDLRINGGSTLF
jgi:NAD(P)-dependent dehydrogenase (short-subunit alcohol dehydrogenase family)